MNITFITGNKSKAEQLAFHLDALVDHHKLDLIEIQSLDLEEVVRDKAQRAWDILQKPVLVEDTSLTFSSLGKLPGPLIKWFLKELDNEGLARLVDEIQSHQGEPSFHVCQIQFYRATIDGSRRLPKPESLKSNFPLLMSLTYGE